MLAPPFRGRDGQVENEWFGHRFLSSGFRAKLSKALISSTEVVEPCSESPRPPGGSTKMIPLRGSYKVAFSSTGSPSRGSTF